MPLTRVKHTLVREETEVRGKHRGTPHIFIRGIGGYTHAKTAVYRGVPPRFYRVNSGI